MEVLGVLLVPPVLIKDVLLPRPLVKFEHTKHIIGARVTIDNIATILLPCDSIDFRSNR